jgi:hypothetical protein
MEAHVTKGLRPVVLAPAAWPPAARPQTFPSGTNLRIPHPLQPREPLMGEREGVRCVRGRRRSGG